MSSDVASVLTDLQWNNGVTIPVANDENKELEKQVNIPLAVHTSAIQNGICDVLSKRE